MVGMVGLVRTCACTCPILPTSIPRSSTGLSTARRQLRRAGPILAYVYDVAAAAGALGAQPPQLQLEGRIALAQLGEVLPRVHTVSLVSAAGRQHAMREHVSGLDGRQ